MADDPKIEDGERSVTLIKQDWQERLAASRRGPPTPAESDAEITASQRPGPLENQAAPSFNTPGAPANARPPGGEARARVNERLEQLVRLQWRQSRLNWAILAMLSLLLVSQVLLLVRLQPLDLRHQLAQWRAWGLGHQGTLRRSPDGQGQPGRAAVTPGPHPEPQLKLADKPGLPSPPVGQAEALPPERPPAAQVMYVGSTRSNKYHYPTCKWAKQIKPGSLIRFKSVEEARQRHYIPCPVCKPPPLGPEP